MKKLLVLSALVALNCNAQVNWQAYPGAPTSGFWDMDTLNGKLYVSTGLVQEFDGVTWNTLSNYNNSSNTPNKTKSCVKTINGKLYAGAKDFNTSGQGTIHYLSSGTWSLQQNSNFAYNGSNKIRAFEQFNSELYTCGLFSVPGSTTLKNVAKWSGTDWIDVGRNFGFYPPTTEVTDLQSFQNKLYLTEGSGVWFYNGSTWDSLISPYNSANVFPMGGTVSDLVIYNGELYISGNFALSSTNYGVLLSKYNGSSFNALAKTAPNSNILSSGTYTAIGKMGVVGNKLYFFAKKTSDNNVYLVSYNGSSMSEIGKVGDYGDFSFSPGNELTTFRKITGYNNDLVIGGTFTKVNGQALGALAYIPNAVGIPEQDKTITLCLFPNPATDKIKISYSLSVSPELIITDVYGKKIRYFANVGNEQEIELHLDKGIYFCSIYVNGSVIKYQKLIIQ